MQVIELDPSCHRGYEQKYAALHGARRYAEAVEAFDTMLRKLEQSPDRRVRGESFSQDQLGHPCWLTCMIELRSQYFDTRSTIRRIIDATISPMPRVLIDTATGQLRSKAQQAEAFVALPIFNELASSMTSKVDYARIWEEVKQFYRYVMFSHKWEDDEPLHQDVKHITVYELEVSPTTAKLQSFCSLVGSLGFRWAWSDTCCIDKDNNVVLQESLVAMFSWYRGSSLTLIYLRGVSSESDEPGGLRWSVWNTRVWTYQEYMAAETVQFYTEDWKPYLGLTLWNHKESPTIVSEMEEASHVSPEQLAVLRPGLDRVREKLYLASTRQTSLVEDKAYSLLGIFNVAIPVIYGEGTRAVGRLLEHVLTGSGDVSILAWTGTANDYNSCLPLDLTVYREVVPPHIPLMMETTEVDRIVAELRASLPDLLPATTLYVRLNDLPPPSLVASRLRLPGIVSFVTKLVHISRPGLEENLYLYRAATTLFGDVEIQTTCNVTTTNALYLVHPWIRPLLDQEFARAGTRLDTTVRALRLLVRLRQPFGALLFEQVSRTEYKRVAADSWIVARVREDVLLTDLIEGSCTIDVQ